ncbi:diguanylate cyclase [Actinoplanes sp. NPDC051851]|uniref:histidine kinase N-terminal 7TM domain-containing diguanylate cyclase n=1 Tax=Actinoplanes sp. NPDC051851 TaxID=3154753 RepID=UPI00342C36A5
MATLVLSAVFAVSVVVALSVLVAAGRRRREAPGFATIAAFAAGAAWWSAASMVTLYTRDETIVSIGIALIYPGVFLLVAAWWATAQALTDRFWRLERRTALLLAVEPVLCTLAIITNPWHHLFISGLRPTVIDGALASVFGPLFWVHALYSYAMIGYSAVKIFRTYLRQASRYRAYLIATVNGLPSTIINIAGVMVGGRLIDLTAAGFVIGAPTMYWLVTRQAGPAIAPVAHREVFRKIPDAVLVLDATRRVIDANPAAARLLADLGVATRDATGRIVLPHRLGVVPGVPDDADGDHEIRDVLGRGIDLSLRISLLHDRRGTPAGCIMVARDVTEQNRQHEHVEYVNRQLRGQLATIEALRASLADQAARDYLTGLFNRRQLMTELTAAIERGTPFAVVLLDIDFFKQVNDRYGHNAGDDVLVHLADALTGALRPGDVAARYGGEEFALLLHGLSGPEAAAWADGLRRAVAAYPLRTGDAEIAVTFSAGVAAGGGARPTPAHLIHDADLALYAAKENGRNRVEQALGTGRLVTHADR